MKEIVYLNIAVMGIGLPIIYSVAPFMAWVLAVTIGITYAVVFSKYCARKKQQHRYV